MNALQRTRFGTATDEGMKAIFFPKTDQHVDMVTMGAVELSQRSTQVIITYYELAEYQRLKITHEKRTSPHYALPQCHPR
jgi:hypothetical protein